MITTKRILILLGIVIWPCLLLAQPDHLTYFKALEQETVGWYGVMQRSQVDSSYSIFLRGNDNAGDVGIWGEEILEENDFEQVVWHLNYNQDLELENYVTEEIPGFLYSHTPLYRIGKRLNGEIVYSTDGWYNNWSQGIQNCNPPIESNIGELSSFSNMVVYNPAAGNINAVYTSADTSAIFDNRPYPYYFPNIRSNTWNGITTNSSLQVNDGIAVYCEDYIGDLAINNDAYFPNVLSHVGYVHSVIDLNANTVESFPVISEQGNYTLESIHLAADGNSQYRIGVVRGDQTKIAPDGTLFTSEPNDSLYHWLLTKESFYGNVEWTRRLNAVNNTLDDSTAYQMFSMETGNMVLDLVENENRIFVSNMRFGRVSETDDYYYTDFFDSTTVYSDLADGIIPNPDYPLRTVFLKSSVSSLTTDGEKLASISKNIKEWWSWNSKNLFPIEDKLAWVNNYRAVEDTTIIFTRTDNQGVSSDFNIELPAGIGTFIVWLNADLEVIDHWLFQSTNRFEIGLMTMHNSDTLLIQGRNPFTMESVNVLMDPAEVWEAVTVPPASLFIALYNNGVVNGLADNFSSETEMKVYPNPATDQLQIALSQRSETTTYSMFDISGRQVQSGLLSNTSQVESISVSDLMPGIYLLKVHSGDIQGVKKVVVE